MRAGPHGLPLRVLPHQGRRGWGPLCPVPNGELGGWQGQGGGWEGLRSSSSAPLPHLFSYFFWLPTNPAAPLPQQPYFRLPSNEATQRWPPIPPPPLTPLSLVIPPPPGAQLPAAKQRSIAEELERTPGEVLKKLEDIRNKIL